MNYLTCEICKKTMYDPNTHQCNWAVLEGRCGHPRKWDIKSDMLSHKILEEGYEPYAVAVYGDVFVHFGKRPKPCDLCDKV